MRSIAAPVDLITFKADHMAACSSTRIFLSVLLWDLAVSEPRVELRRNSYFDSHRITIVTSAKLQARLQSGALGFLQPG